MEEADLDGLPVVMLPDLAVLKDVSQVLQVLCKNVRPFKRSEKRVAETNSSAV